MNEDIPEHAIVKVAAPLTVVDGIRVPDKKIYI